MAQVIKSPLKIAEWRANTTGNPKYLRNLDWFNLYCHINHCGGILEYVYGCMWRCRTCGRWHEHTPKV